MNDPTWGDGLGHIRALEKRIDKLEYALGTLVESMRTRRYMEVDGGTLEPIGDDLADAMSPTIGEDAR